MPRYPKKSLLDLPVRPNDRDRAASTSIVQNTYLHERAAIRSPKELRPFIKRWQNLWLLRPGPIVAFAKPGSWLHQANRRMLWCEQAMLEGHFDAKRVTERLLQQPNIEPRTFNPEERDWRIVGHLGIPAPLYIAFQVAKHYRVGHDLVLVRLFLDSYPNLIDRLRNEGPVFFQDPSGRDEDDFDEVSDAVSPAGA